MELSLTSIKHQIHFAFKIGYRTFIPFRKQRTQCQRSRDRQTTGGPVPVSGIYGNDFFPLIDKVFGEEDKKYSSDGKHVLLDSSEEIIQDLIRHVFIASSPTDCH